MFADVATTEAKLREKRAAWLVGLGNLPSAYGGEIEPMTLLREARACFLEGHYMAAILCAAAHVEHTLVEALELREHVSRSASPSFDAAIKLARTHNLFRDPSVLDKIDALRLVRNPLTHRKPEKHPHAIATKFRTQDRHPILILEDDARLALEVMHGLFFATLRPLE